MPIIRLREVTEMDSAERNKKLSELRAELSRLRTMISAGGAVENPARIRELRRAIARILTIENQQKNKQKKTKERPKRSKQETTEKAEKPAKTKLRENKKE